ncbi:MAG: ketopantoate reductase family protein [candidate division NC10 bacterium]|nr:ketopantoate reductase family protein [candidate division NC10 bacterium]
MRIAVVGAGALGSLYGARLAAAGHAVSLLARPEAAAAIASGGITVEGGEGAVEPVRSVRVTTTPADLAGADLLLLAVKTYHTAETLPALACLRGRLGAVCSVQNGVTKDAALAAAFGEGAVLGAMSLEGATLLTPGRVLWTSPASTAFGELDGRATPRLQAVVAAFREAGLKAEALENIVAAIWAKFGIMVPGATLGVLSRLPLYRLYQEPALATLFIALCREVRTLAEASGVPWEDFPGMRVATLCRLPTEEAVRLLAERGRGWEATGATALKVSTLVDLERRKRTELPDLVGYVAAEGARRGLHLPYATILGQAAQAVAEAAAR